MTDRHVAGDLGVYLAGALEAREGWAVESHLAACGWCSNELRELREVTALLDGMPPEVLLDGPPDGSDLLLRRTVRQIRRESRRGRRVLGAAAAVLVGAAGVAGGFAYGQQTNPSVVAVQQQPPASTAPVEAPVDALVAKAADARTGAEAEVTVTPSAGYVRVSATVEGVPPGERCRMMVVTKDGDRQMAFAWITGEGNGEPLTGSALVAPDDVASIDVESEDGRTFVSVPL
ncbi:zf-HC2 domain-containing protein [Pseudonocardia humida]|uniref:Zf-HC2 domain-containing protein n=1 Tax=Pseudonocardia humida TaxID=2800819 RepID=A0ABT1A398_9PSEU|nr:zf-HC2 domain-containing protein [Pseudonocardia humida]MCO1657465.1 zf-HC2 domain-containing protein [Pseudonocardia humida]